MTNDTTKREKVAQTYDREQEDWYVEPSWCVDLLLSAIKFNGSIYDPACGYGTIPKACIAAGYESVSGTDLVDRGYGLGGQDFLRFNPKLVGKADNIITNPPYKLAEDFIRQALRFSREKVAVLMPMKFLNSNIRYPLFTRLPVWRVCVLSTRPSMPPGRFLTPDGVFAEDDASDKQRWRAGDEPSGGAIDYCWIVFKHGYEGTAGTVWLKRERVSGRRSRNPVSKPAVESSLSGGVDA